jgi:hypothetical protein
MVSLTIELITWGIYFSVGILLLVMLVFARQTLKKIEAKRREADKVMQRFHLGKEVPDVWNKHARDRYIR